METSVMLDFVMDPQPMSVSLVGGRGHYEAVIARVLKAEVSVWIGTANLKALMIEGPRRPGRRRRGWTPIVEMLLAKAREGVEVSILHASPPSGPLARMLDELDLQSHPTFRMRQCPRVHLKTIVVDGAFLYLGSANWTGAGLGAKGDSRRNFELGICTEDESLIDQIQEIFHHLWEGGACADCGRREYCPQPIDAYTPPTCV